MQILRKFFRTRFLPLWLLGFTSLFALVSLGWTEPPAAQIPLTRTTATAPVALTTSSVAVTTPANKKPLTHEYLLSNGLKLIVREDHRAPVAIFQIWYKVGSSYEPAGLTGISHLLEHMMFKGTNRLKPGEFSRRIAEYGGVENASTTRDYTLYYQQWEASRIPISFELEANRMQHLSFSATEFAKEHKVVMEERRMRTDDNPQAKTYERFLESAYIASPYQQPVVGWMEDLRRLTLDDIKRWHQQWYAPNNAVIVVVGDVNPAAMLALAQRYFGAIPAKTLPPAPSARDIPAISERELRIHLPAQLPLLLMGYNLPSLTTAENPRDAYALRMLAGILDSGHSARIETQLVRQQHIAASAGADYGPFSRGDALLVFSGLPNKGVTMDAVKTAYLAMIEDLKTTPVTPEEMARVRAQVISSLIYEQDSIGSQASNIGELETMGLSWKLLDTYVAQLQAVTAEHIQQVAQKYLTRDRLTTTELEPQVMTVNK